VGADNLDAAFWGNSDNLDMLGIGIGIANAILANVADTLLLVCHSELLLVVVEKIKPQIMTLARMLAVIAGLRKLTAAHWLSQFCNSMPMQQALRTMGKARPFRKRLFWRGKNLYIWQELLPLGELWSALLVFCFWGFQFCVRRVAYDDSVSIAPNMGNRGTRFDDDSVSVASNRRLFTIRGWVVNDVSDIVPITHDNDVFTNIKNPSPHNCGNDHCLHNLPPIQSLGAGAAFRGIRGLVWGRSDIDDLNIGFITIAALVNVANAPLYVCHDELTFHYWKKYKHKP
jgi:hypothetical protein